MNIQEGKAATKSVLEEVRMEAVLLIARIDEALKDLKDVKTLDDLEKFGEKHEGIEKGLEHIELF